PYRVFSTKEELSIITGERLSGVFGITDENFAASILGELAKKEER
ncbi:MAG: 50S ribosomal protein L7ae, partial [Clostridiales bacterium]|nr:50S ribosomal protein L7ae [Clostridiales bacterium]